MKQDKETLSAKIEELEAKQKYNNSRRVLIASTPKEELNIKTDDQLKASL
nr:MAG TPA: hypothetical protein [Bacteriophage sp.]